MPTPWARIVGAGTGTDTALTTATEAVIATVPGVNTDGPSQVIRLIGWVTLLTAAGVTGITYRWRRGSLTGTLVGEANSVNKAATTSYVDVHASDDTPGEVASQAYVLTATTAGGNGTAQAVEVVALVLA